MQEYIHVKGAREHNLKNIDIKIPRDKLVVFTGLSGSGKSSLAFDTIYAEGQRRYVESVSYTHLSARPPSERTARNPIHRSSAGHGPPQSRVRHSRAPHTEDLAARRRF